jgi:hypothetical protein
LTSPSISSLVMSCSSVNPEIKPSSSAMGMLATRTTRGSRVGMCDATNRQRARFGNASEFASLTGAVHNVAPTAQRSKFCRKKTSFSLQPQKTTSAPSSTPNSGRKHE